MAKAHTASIARAHAEREPGPLDRERLRNALSSWRAGWIALGERVLDEPNVTDPSCLEMRPACARVSRSGEALASIEPEDPLLGAYIYSSRKPRQYFAALRRLLKPHGGFAALAQSLREPDIERRLDNAARGKAVIDLETLRLIRDHVHGGVATLTAAAQATIDSAQAKAESEREFRKGKPGRRGRR